MGEVVGTSMDPTINGHKLLIKTVRADKLQIGDIIAYRIYILKDNKTIPIVHRIVEINEGGFLTKGDNNDYIDEWLVEPKNLVGKVIYIYKDKSITKIKNNKI